MENKTTQINCASVVAYLEGRNLIPLPDDVLSASSSLNVLDKRVRQLENQFQIAKPPPCLDQTWESLALRVYRLQRRDLAESGGGSGKKGRDAAAAAFPNGFLDLVPQPVDVTIQTLQTLCAEINALPGGGHYPVPYPKTANDEEALDVIRQRLCHSAGQSRQNLRKIPVDRSEIYAALVDLTMDSASEYNNSNNPLAPRPTRINANRPTMPSPKKACCGCCDCFCHKAPIVVDAGSSSSSSTTAAARKGKGFSRLSWLGRLAFWRRPKASGSSSGSSRA